MSGRRYGRGVSLSLAAVLLASAPAFAQSTEAVAKGAAVYTAQKCGVCHSVAGVGNKRGALDDVGARLSVEDLRMWIVDAAAMTKKTNAERKPPMRSYANLPADDVDALVAYMSSLKP